MIFHASTSEIYSEPFFCYILQYKLSGRHLAEDNSAMCKQLCIITALTDMNHTLCK